MPLDYQIKKVSIDFNLISAHNHKWCETFKITFKCKIVFPLVTSTQNSTDVFVFELIRIDRLNRRNEL